MNVWPGVMEVAYRSYEHGAKSDGGSLQVLGTWGQDRDSFALKGQPNCAGAHVFAIFTGRFSLLFITISVSPSVAETVSELSSRTGGRKRGVSRLCMLIGQSPFVTQNLATRAIAYIIAAACCQ